MGFWDSTPTKKPEEQSGGFWGTQQSKAPLLKPKTSAEKIAQYQSEAPAYKKATQQATGFWGVAKNTIKGIPGKLGLTDIGKKDAPSFADHTVSNIYNLPGRIAETIAPQSDRKYIRETQLEPYKGLGKDTAKAFAQGIGRSYVATGQAIYSGSTSKPYMGAVGNDKFAKFNQALTGTDKPISARQEDKDFLGEKYGGYTAGGATVGLTALDLAGGGGVKGVVGLTRTLKAAKTAEEAAKALRAANFSEDIIKDYAPVFAKTTDTKEITKGIQSAQNLQNTTKTATAPLLKPVYKGETDLSTKILKDLEGRSTVSRQYLEDATNRPDIKQAERDLIRKTLADEGDTISVPDFANKVKSELLPLTRWPNKNIRYESISLPDELRGPVGNYSERVYTSPIKTSAGDIHFSDGRVNDGTKFPDYFAHSRIEDLPASNRAAVIEEGLKKGRYASEGRQGRIALRKELADLKAADRGGTRRVIEIQSDLFQKGRLEEERLPETISANTTQAEQKILNQKRFDETAKLEPYRNTWHERLIREEVKQAAKDGKTKLQFPTGETAMKIEGLGERSNWTTPRVVGDDGYVAARPQTLSPENLKVGEEVWQSADRNQAWIITDVLGDGKFKAVPKDKWEYAQKATGMQKSFAQAEIARWSETFDISGKVDTENPIYRFYDKTVRKYLTNKYGAKEVTDAQGVKWLEVDLKGKGYEKAPVEAFGAGAGVQQDEEGNFKFDPAIAGAGLLGIAALRKAKGALSQADQLIAEGKLRVVSRDGKDVYQVKKGGDWVNTRDEASAVKQLTEPILKKEKVDSPIIAEKKQELENMRAEIDIREYALGDMPGRLLRHRVSRTTGDLPELTGKKDMKSLTGSGRTVKNSEWGERGDQLLQDIVGQERSKGGDQIVGQQLLDEYRDAKKLLDERKQDYKLKKEELRHLKHSKEGVPLAYTEREKAILSKGSPAPLLQPGKQIATPKASRQLPVSPQTGAKPPLLRKSEGEMRSIELQARQAEGASIPRGVEPLEEMVKQTPLENKVTIVDYLRTPDRVLKKIGLEKEAKELRAGHEAYLKELPKNIEKITEWSKRVGTAAGGRIFRYLDGQPVTLAPREKEVAMEIKSYLSTWADRLGLPEDKRIADYITHIFDDQLIKKEFDEDLAKIIADKIPGTVYNPFLEKRLGAKGYKENVWDALDAYTKRATRKVHMDPALSAIEEKAGTFELSQFNYVKKYIDNVNMRPKELETLADNFLKNIPAFGYRLGQRPTLAITRFMRKTAYRAMLGLNPGSALRNLSQGANVYAKLGEKHTVLGYAKLFSPAARRELIESGILGDNFIQDRSLNATRKMMEKVDKGLFVFFDAAEKINRGAAYLGGKSKGLAKGMSEKEAIEYAKKIVRDTQFNYGAVDTPVGMSGDLVKTATQFMSYPVKQSEFLLGMAKEKDIAGIARYTFAGLTFVYTIGEAMGMDPWEILPTFRFGVPPSLQLPVEVGKAAVDAPDDYGRDRTTTEKLKDVGESALRTAVPGGTQAFKTYGGAKMVAEGASYTKNGNLQFRQKDTLPAKAQSIIFGKYAGDNAEEYFDKRENPTPPDAIDKAAEARTLYKNKTIRPIYDQAQKLKAEGKMEEANALWAALSEKDKEIYKGIKTAEKTKATLELERKLLPLYEKLQDMKAAGQKAEADAIYYALSPEEQHAYTLLKKKLQ